MQAAQLEARPLKLADEPLDPSARGWASTALGIQFGVAGQAGRFAPSVRKARWDWRGCGRDDSESAIRTPNIWPWALWKASQHCQKPNFKCKFIGQGQACKIDPYLNQFQGDIPSPEMDQSAIIHFMLLWQAYATGESAAFDASGT
ncbi:hypothetical protein HPP92_003672 [Vanilla planifolia]|uniref:Uncharacterized protein n=1 Tax=Vanilla planifolia TaxID=51239 RepID=A0A835RVB5_VANPL|nr:hypothetical protein HPP92_003672 [Vanilla planifolia]